jgi:hypothetical protein
MPEEISKWPRHDAEAGREEHRPLVAAVVEAVVPTACILQALGTRASTSMGRPARPERLV